MLVLDIISFVAFLIVLFLMWRKIKTLEEDKSVLVRNVAEALSNLNLSKNFAQKDIYQLQVDIGNLKYQLRNAEFDNGWAKAEIRLIKDKANLLADTLGLEYVMEQKLIAPHFIKKAKKTKSGAK